MTATLSPPATSTGSAVCNRGELLDMLTIACAVIKTRTPRPILLCVRVTVDENELRLTTTNLESQARCVCRQLQVESPFDTAVNAEHLFRIVREMSDEALALRFDGVELEVSGTDAKLKLKTANVAEFPPAPETDGADFIMLPAKMMLRLVRQSSEGTDIKRETRFASEAVAISVVGKRVVAVGTDGISMAVSCCDAPPKAKLGLTLIPLQFLSLVTRVLEMSEEVAVGANDRRVFFDAGDVRIESNIIEGMFVPYEDVIPKQSEMKVTVCRESLQSRLKLASLSTDDVTKMIRMKGSRSRGLTFSGRTEKGGAHVDLPCKFDGSDIEIGINPLFTIGFLGVAETAEVTIELTAPNRPILLRAGPDFLFVQMPCNLQ